MTQSDRQMTKAQAFAFAHPLARAHEVLSPEFLRVFKYRNKLVSVLLTVNK